MEIEDGFTYAYNKGQLPLYPKLFISNFVRSFISKDNHHLLRGVLYFDIVYSGGILQQRILFYRGLILHVSQTVVWDGTAFTDHKAVHPLTGAELAAINVSQ